MFSVSPEKLTLISDKQSPLYDPRVELPLNENLVRSIMTNGFRTVITVYKDGENLIVTSGRQRVRAALEANARLAKDGKEPVYCLTRVERGDDADHFGMSLIENTNRQDESDIQIARKMQRLIQMGRAEEDAGATCGLDKIQTKRMLALLDLAEPVQRAVASGKISTCAAVKFAKLDRAEQTKARDSALAESGGKRVRVAAAERKVKRSVVADTQEVSFPGRKQIKNLCKYFIANAKSVNLPHEALSILEYVLNGNEVGCVKIAIDAMNTPNPIPAPEKKPELDHVVVTKETISGKVKIVDVE